MFIDTTIKVIILHFEWSEQFNYFTLMPILCTVILCFFLIITFSSRRFNKIDFHGIILLFFEY